MRRTAEHGVRESACPWAAANGKAESSWVGGGHGMEMSSTYMTGAFSESCCASNNLSRAKAVSTTA